MEDRTDAGQWRDRGTERCPGDRAQGTEACEKEQEGGTEPGFSCSEGHAGMGGRLGRRAGTRDMALGSSRLGCGLPLPISILVPAPLLGMWLRPR